MIRDLYNTTTTGRDLVSYQYQSESRNYRSQIKGDDHNISMTDLYISMKIELYMIYVITYGTFSYTDNIYKVIYYGPLYLL